MKIVIDISDETYEDVKKYESMVDIEVDEVAEAIANGKPLPKGHGDLIDRDGLLADSYCIDDWSGNEVNIVDVKTVKMADAIIGRDDS